MPDCLQGHSLVLLASGSNLLPTTTNSALVCGTEVQQLVLSSDLLFLPPWLSAHVK